MKAVKNFVEGKVCGQLVGLVISHSLWLNTRYLEFYH